ncbi:hypothetical protein DL769_001972 [Monosporascus sp. CRB-8-3]|nr:hypothetical protein DL769_001972 [Monosporascus sp. CRB-8-3]
MTKNPVDSHSAVETELAEHNIAPPRTVRHSIGFWAIIVGLGVTLLLSALENSELVTAALVILEHAAFQPFIGQLCNVFGRRWVTLSIVAIFILGSGICGGATSGGMLIAGRAVQGVGSGGIIMVFDIIVSDLVPLRLRGNYVAVIMLIYSIGTTLCPFIGGAIVETGNWRWVFYLNLPVGGTSFLILFFFVHVNYRRDPLWTSRLRRLGFIGNGILIAGSTAILVALTYAGTRYPWGSWQTLVPTRPPRASWPAAEQIRAVNRLAIRRVWVVSFAFMGTALLLVLLERDIPLRRVLETEYGMKERGSGRKVTTTSRGIIRPDSGHGQEGAEEVTQ